MRVKAREGEKKGEWEKWKNIHKHKTYSYEKLIESHERRRKNRERERKMMFFYR